jgi:DNA excision repair protein ERCC-4
MENMDLNITESQPPIVFIQPFKNYNGGICLEDTLHELKPDYIVMYHSDITATRQVELYEARRSDKENPLTVFFLMHAQTTEEQSYLTSLRKEKESFEMLIETKSVIVDRFVSKLILI